MNARASIVKAALWMAGALLSFSAMAVAARELASDLHTFQILFFRSAIGLALIAIFLTAQKRWASVRTRRWREHLLRNGVHFAAQYAWFVAIALLPLAQVFAIEFTVPLWTLLLARVVLGERFTPAKILAVLLGLIGVMLIVRPGAQSIAPATLIMLVGALGFAVSYLIVKRLVATDSAMTVIFWMAMLQLPMALLPALLYWRWPDATAMPAIFVVGLTAVTAHFCLSRALNEADASVVAPMDFLRLPLIALVGAALYAEPFDPMVMIGGAIMVAGNLLNLRASRAQQSPPA